MLFLFMLSIVFFNQVNFKIRKMQKMTSANIALLLLKLQGLTQPRSQVLSSSRPLERERERERETLGTSFGLTVRLDNLCES